MVRLQALTATPNSAEAKAPTSTSAPEPEDLAVSVAARALVTSNSTSTTEAGPKVPAAVGAEPPAGGRKGRRRRKG
jgi:hypothetical protein